MAVAYEALSRGWPSTSGQQVLCLEDKFDVLKEIGDGSFGSVALGRTRGAGASIARKGSLVAIKTMKKTFDNFSQCLELREVVFLRSLPPHPHLVPAYDIFLDPVSRKLHIAMEYMDGNLYQLLKARDHKPLDASSVKSILFQILGGLDHIHDHHFFHRDIKPENILVSTSTPESGSSAFKRYSALVTPPSTPPTYTVKIADFGLARETYSRVPYTTYVSTRWYRAPEVLLRAGEYSAPVDMWAIGAMAVEVATLKPLFPGGNEVDQVWRVCKIMGSPGSWMSRDGRKIGGGEWKDGIRLAQKLGFSFPKMAPHSLDAVLPSPQWPAGLPEFITWCLMWDPKVRPTSKQALSHEYFADAVDPLRPKSNASSKVLGRKPSTTWNSETDETSHVKSTSWLRRSLHMREHTPQPSQTEQVIPARVRPVPAHSLSEAHVPQAAQTSRPPKPTKRATWALPSSNAAPIPILPSIRPISPLQNGVTVERYGQQNQQPAHKPKKVGRQLSVNSQSNHYTEIHRREAERMLNGQSESPSMKSTTDSQKEGFFSHLRKRARRLSGRHSGFVSPGVEDIEVDSPDTQRSVQQSERMSVDQNVEQGFNELDRALANVRDGIDASKHQPSPAVPQPKLSVPSPAVHGHTIRRHLSVPHMHVHGRKGGQNIGVRSRSIRHVSANQQYEAPDEEDELLDEALRSAFSAVRKLDEQPARNSPVIPDRRSPAVANAQLKSQRSRSNLHQQQQKTRNRESIRPVPYLTPSPSKENRGVEEAPYAYPHSKPINIPSNHRHEKHALDPHWPTPPYDENDWAAAAAASIFATQASLR